MTANYLQNGEAVSSSYLPTAPGELSSIRLSFEKMSSASVVRRLSAWASSRTARKMKQLLAAVVLLLIGQPSIAQAPAPVINFEKLWNAQKELAEAHNGWVEDATKIFAKADKDGRSQYSPSVTVSLREAAEKRRLKDRFDSFIDALYE